MALKNQNERKSSVFYKEYFPMTIASAYFDISRKGRPKKLYFEWIKQTIKLNAPFVFFTQAKFKNKIEKIFNFEQKKNFKIITIELNELDYYEDISIVKDILESKDYKGKIDNPNRIECTLPLYSIVQHAKLTLLLKSAKLNLFDSSKFIWMDAGISRFFKNFDLKQKLTGNLIANNSFFISTHNGAFDDMDFKLKNEEIIWAHKNFFIGGIMGGSYQSILNMSIELKNKWKYILSKRVVNNEQIVLMLVYFKKPYLFNLTLIKNMDYLEEVLKILE